MIEFERFDLRYRENLDLALRGVECEIKQGEKVNTNQGFFQGFFKGPLNNPQNTILS